MCSEGMTIQIMSILRITGVWACETGGEFCTVSKNEKNYTFESGWIYENHYKRREVSPLLQIRDAYPKLIIARTNHYFDCFFCAKNNQNNGFCLQILYYMI